MPSSMVWISTFCHMRPCTSSNIFITGRVTLSHVIPALALRAILCGILLALVAIPWWNFVGIM